MRFVKRLKGLFINQDSLDGLGPVGGDDPAEESTGFFTGMGRIFGFGGGPTDAVPPVQYISNVGSFMIR